MVGEIFAGVGAFKAAMDIAKSLKDMDSAAARNAAVVELTEKIITAQAAQQELLARVGELEKELVRFEDWETERQRYELKDVGAGAFAYRLKEDMRNGQPTHDICANCYEDRHKSILKPEQWQPMRARVLLCHDCGSVLYVGGQPHQDHEKLRPRGRRR